MVVNPLISHNKEIVVKRSELDALMRQDNPDEKKVAKLTGDLYPKFTRKCMEAVLLLTSFKKMVTTDFMRQIFFFSMGPLATLISDISLCALVQVHCRPANGVVEAYQVFSRYKTGTIDDA